MSISEQADADGAVTGAAAVVRDREVSGGSHAHPGEAADFALTASVPAPPSVPLVVPQRRVPSDRLHGRDGFVNLLADGIRARARGDGSGTPSVWALCGLGGTGKTTIALEVAHRVGPLLRHTWWVSASEPTGLMAALRAVAVNAGAAPAEFDHLHPADVLWRQLDALPEPWLLVLDNVDDLDVVSAAAGPLADGTGWLREPRSPRGTVVVTSRETRTERWGPWVALHEVDSLAVGDGARVLVDLAPEAGDVREAESLAAALGGLPLALDLAGSYLATAAKSVWPDEDEPTTFAAYRSAFAHRLSDVTVEGHPRGRDKARRDIVTTWELSLDLLARQGHDVARPLLRLLSCFAEFPLPHRLVLHLDVLRTDARFAELTGRQLRDALQGLVGLRLITVAPGDAGRALDMHPVVRAGSRAGRGAENLPLVTALLVRATADLDPEDPATWPSWSALAPHCAAALRLLAESPAADDEQVLSTTRLAVAAARHQFAAGYFQDTEAVLRSVLGIREARFGPTHPETLHALRHLARALLENGRHQSALTVYEQALELSRPVFTPADPHMLSVRRGLGRALWHCGRFEPAREVFHALVTLLVDRDVPDDDPEIVMARHEHATVLLKLGELDQAEREFRSLFALQRVIGGETDRLALDSRFNICRCLRRRGRLAEAVSGLGDTIGIATTSFPPEHPMLLAMRHERARNLRDLGRVDEAELELRQVSDITRNRLGEVHPATVSTRHELATVLHLRGHLAKARAEFEAVWSINVEHLGVRHPDTLMSRHNLACVLLDSGAAAQAREHLREVAAVRADVLGADHPDTRTTEALLAATAPPRDTPTPRDGPLR